LILPPYLYLWRLSIKEHSLVVAAFVYSFLTERPGLFLFLRITVLVRRKYLVVGVDILSDLVLGSHSHINVLLTLIDHYFATWILNNTWVIW